MWARWLGRDVRPSLIGAQMVANYQKSHSSQYVCQEHDVADGKNDAPQEQEDTRHCSYWPFKAGCLFAVGHAALRRPEVS